MAFVHLYYDPLTEFDRLFEDALAARVCPRVHAKRATPQQGHVFRPRLDVHESKENDTVTATFELPGLTSEDVVIDVQQNRLTVSGPQSADGSDSDEVKEEKNYVIRERRSGKFSRTLQLPYATRPEDVKAKMENGILTITFPKTSPEAQAKRISVQ